MAINTRDGNKLAYSINPRGGYEQLDFQFNDNTEVYRSCSLQWKNHYYVFGGENQKKQVSMVNENRLERKGSLNFDFDRGACTVLNQVNIVLCFDYHETKFCRKSNKPLGSFAKLLNSNYDHRYTRIASFDGENKIYLTI